MIARMERILSRPLRLPLRSKREATLREFKGATPENPVVGAAKATARLPNLDIEILSAPVAKR